MSLTLPADSSEPATSKSSRLDCVEATDSTIVQRNLTLPNDSVERKQYPLLSGCLKYFPAALAGVSRVSAIGNQKHNPGQPMHHARGKSGDHGDCLLRHLVDTEDLLAKGNVDPALILNEASSVAWRALAYAQELHEKLGGAPLAPGARSAELP